MRVIVFIIGVLMFLNINWTDGGTVRDALVFIAYILVALFLIILGLEVWI